MGGPKGTGGGKAKGGGGGGYWEAKGGGGGGYWEEKGDNGKGRKDGGKGKGGWKGEGKWWPEEDKGKGKGKDGKEGKGKKGDEWRGKGKEEWVPKDRSHEGESWKGQKGKGKAQSSQNEEPEGSVQREGRSQLSSSAPDFKPSGLYDYDAMAAQYWNWQPLVQELPPLWREYADKDGAKYYYNSKTGLSQWERPADLDPPQAAPAEPAIAFGSSAPASASSGHAQSSAAGKGRDTGSSSGPRRDRDGNDRDELRKLRNEDDGGGKSDGKGKRENRRRPGKPSDAGAGKTEPTFGPPGCNLFVFHLPDDWADDDLLEYFAPHGTVVSAKVMKELGTGRSRGFGFVSYEDRVSAATAIKKMQGYKILGKRLKVEFKKGEGDNRGEGEDRLDLPEENKSSGDDERLIGYLRAISAKSVVQSLKESERAAGGARSDDEGGDFDEDKD